MPLADEWKIYDNTGRKPKVIAEKLINSEEVIHDKIFWNDLMKELKEPREIYSGDKLDQLVQEAIREELDRRYKLNLPIVFMEGDKKIRLEGKDYYKYLAERDRKKNKS